MTVILTLQILKIDSHVFAFSGLFPEMEANVNEWFQDRVARKLPVSSEDIRNAALELYQQWWNNLPADRQAFINANQPHLLAFTASAGWLVKFNERCVFWGFFIPCPRHHGS